MESVEGVAGSSGKCGCLKIAYKKKKKSFVLTSYVNCEYSWLLFINLAFIYLPSSFLFNIPQKLSYKTESVPFNHRTTTLTPFSSIPSCLTCTLNPRAALLSSTPALCSARVSAFGILRRACRDQAFSFAKPIPVPRFLRQCHWIGRALSSVSSLLHRSSMGVLVMLKVDSDGNGSRCLGKPVIPRATFYI